MSPQRMLLAICAVQFLLILALLVAPGISIPSRPVDTSSEFNSCMTDAKSVKAASTDTVNDTSKNGQDCYYFVQQKYLLRAFDINERAFAINHWIAQRLLWLVLILTLSGIGLAALQLFTAHRLARSLGPAAAPDTTEFVVSRETLTLKSSYVGLSMLALSFLFFLVYVIAVSGLQPVGHDNSRPGVATSNSHDATTGRLSFGGIGSPPSGKATDAPAKPK